MKKIYFENKSNTILKIEDLAANIIETLNDLVTKIKLFRTNKHFGKNLF